MASYKLNKIFIQIFLTLSLLWIMYMVYERSDIKEGMNTRVHNKSSLEQTEYLSDGRLYSEDRKKFLRIKNGKLQSYKYLYDKNGKKRKHAKGWTKTALLWKINIGNANMMLLNEMGNLIFINSVNKDETTLSSETSDGVLLELTPSGDIELKNAENDVIWTQKNVTEGMTSDIANSIDNDASMKIARLDEIQKQKDATLESAIKQSLDNTNEEIINEPQGAVDGWNEFYKKTCSGGKCSEGMNIIEGACVYYDSTTITSVKNTEYHECIEGDRETIEQDLKELNMLDDSHSKLVFMKTDRTIYASVLWTTLMSTLVYYTIVK